MRNALQRLAAILVSSWSACSIGAPLCGDFYYPEVGADFEDRMSPALFWIKSGGESGTAFLVDNEHGLAITARHVVKEHIRDPSVFIEGTNRADPFAQAQLPPVRFHLWKGAQPDQGLEVAIIESEPSNALAGIKPFELSFMTPGHGFRVTTWGFPGGIGSPVHVEGKLQWATDGLIFSHSTLPGFSGAPVFNPYGLVVGVVRSSRHGAHLGVIEPLSGMVPVFRRLPALARAQTLSRSLKADTVQEDELRQLMKPPHIPPALSNLELLQLMSALGNVDALPAAAKNLINCPVRFAIIHRQLYENVDSQNDPIVGMSDLDIGRAFLDNGIRWKESGYLAEAAVTLSKATSVLESVVQKEIEENPTSILQIACREEPAQTTESLEAVRKAFFGPASNVSEGQVVGVDPNELCAGFGGNAFLAGVLRDRAIANLQLDSVEDATQLTKESVKYAAAATSLSQRDTNIRAANVELLGDTLLKAGAPEAAAWAYADALQSEYTPPGVRSKYDEAMERAVARSDRPSVLIKWPAEMQSIVKNSLNVDTLPKLDDERSIRFAIETEDGGKTWRMDKPKTWEEEQAARQEVEEIRRLKAEEAKK